MAIKTRHVLPLGELLLSPLCQSKMSHLILLLLFCHFSSPVKHSLKYYFTASSGIPNFPEYVVAVLVDDVLVGYCDNIIKTVEAKQDWVKTVFQKEPQHLELYTQECIVNGPNYFKNTMTNLKQRYNQTGGVHVLQRMNGCEWDDETGEMKAFNQYGYDGEDLIAFDLKTLSWIAPKQQAFTTKLRWNADRPRIKHNENFLTKVFPAWLKNYVHHGKSILMRTELPSVSLLQKTPSSPVSCHATGFYPDRAALIWRKDGEELHEDMEHGEILPNHDGTFQKSVDLNLSSVSPKDWWRYDCVFRLFGVKDAIVTRLDKAVIMTNWEEPSNKTAVTISVVVVIAFIGIVAMGSIHFRKRGSK